ncbi:MAG: transposase [Nocardioidaceae bacterium]
MVALGIGIDRRQAPAGAWSRGPPTNTTLVRGLLVRAARAGPGRRQADPPAVLDGAKALAAAVKEVFDQPVIGRCQIHKLRNVADHLPKLRGPVRKRIERLPPIRSRPGVAQALDKELDENPPGAAAWTLSHEPQAGVSLL